MRNLFASVFILIVGTAASAADLPQGVTVNDVAAIRDTISRQIAAFRRDDGEAAFGLATAGIRGTFQTAENFMTMVRQGYPSVYRPSEVEFRDLLTVEGRIVQTVLVVGPDGKAMLAFYPMQRQDDGRWLTDGCWLVAVPEQTT
jgi:hypothetical protein